MKKVTLKRGRKEIITKKRLQSAKARGLSRKGLAEELSTTTSAVSSSQTRHAVYLPANIPQTEAEKRGDISTSVRVCRALANAEGGQEAFCGAAVAAHLNVSRQRVNQIAKQWRDSK
jgi:hypothetical protein